MIAKKTIVLMTKYMTFESFLFFVVAAITRAITIMAMINRSIDSWVCVFWSSSVKLFYGFEKER